MTQMFKGNPAFFISQSTIDRNKSMKKWLEESKCKNCGGEIVRDVFTGVPPHCIKCGKLETE